MATPTLKPTINKYQEAKNLVNSHQKAREQVRTEGMSDIYISFKNLNLSPEEYAYMKKKLEGENFLEEHFLDFEGSDEYQEALALEAEAEGMIQNMIEKGGRTKPEAEEFVYGFLVKSLEESQTLEAKELEQQLLNYVAQAHDERINRLKTTGMLDIEGGYDIQTHLTDKEKSALQTLDTRDMSIKQKNEREYQGEKYTILTLDIKGETYTAIQIPQRLRTMKYQDTHMGKQLMKFKDEDWYPAFLNDTTLQAPLNQDWLIWESEPAKKADGTPHTDIELYNDGDSKGDIIRECAKRGMGMLTITDCMLMAELIKGKFGEEYLSEEFTESNFGSERTSAEQLALQQKLKEIEEEFQIQYFVNTTGSKGYLNREYSVYRQQKSWKRNGKDEYFAGFVRESFNSGNSALGGAASVMLYCGLGLSRSHRGFRPRV